MMTDLLITNNYSKQGVEIPLAHADIHGLALANPSVPRPVTANTRMTSFHRCQGPAKYLLLRGTQGGKAEKR